MDSLQPEPTIEADGWLGYQHFTDPTLLPVNVLTYPSQNCSIPSKDKIVPDKAKLLLGQEFTQNEAVMGNKEKFTTADGIELEVRVWPSDQSIIITTIIGSFEIGELITGASSHSRGTIISKDSNLSGNFLILIDVLGAFTPDEIITGATSGATAHMALDKTTYGDVIEVLYTNPVVGSAHYNSPYWYQITPRLNPLARGVHRYSFAQWFDTNLDPTQSLNDPRLIWVNGLAQVFSWIGSVAPIINVFNNYLTVSYATIAYAGASSNFFPPSDTITGGASGATGRIAINSQDGSVGTMQIVTTGGTFQNGETITGSFSATTATITLYTPAPVTWESLGFSSTAGPDDVIINGYIYSGVTGYNTGSLQFAPTTPTVIIGDVAFSSIRADDVDQVFDFCCQTKNYMYYGNWKSRPLWQSNAFNRPSTQEITNSQAVQNDLIVSGDYIGTERHVIRYQIDSIVSDPEEYFYDPAPAAGVTPDNLFFSGQHVGTSRDTYTVKITDATAGSAKYQVLKNGASVATNQAVAYGTQITLPGATSDGIKITFVSINESATPYILSESWTYIVGGQDTYSIFIDGAAISSHIPTATSYTGTANVVLKVNSTSGHSIGDFWEVTVNQAVDDAWFNFYYNLPVRRPGEGYIFRLPSNFWTMDTQEDKLYINTQFGEWSVVDTVLSSDLVSETVSLLPLKQSGSLKVIDPWMTGHLEDDLMFVTLDKSLMSLGRKEFLQEPQDGYLSDPVKYDFLPCTFVGGSIKYIGKRLYISSPAQGIMHCYDVAKGHWQPPKTFSEVGILSIVLNDLICHSNVRNQSFTIFKNVSDNGQPYQVVMRTAFTPFAKMVNRHRIPARWSSKYSSNSFIEGYISGAPELVHTVFLGVNDNDGKSHIVKPVLQNTVGDHASLGEAPHGTHPLGNDPAINGQYFNEIFRKYSPLLSYYFIAMQISCISKNHSYSILSLGMNMSFAPTGNNTLIGDRQIDEL